MKDILERLRAGRVYDLAQPYFVGMPHYPSHPPFLFGLTHEHATEKAVSSASDALAMSGHTGTHMDALCHFSRAGKLHGGVPLAGAQSHGGGVSHLSIGTVAPILRRGVLLDIAGTEGTDELSDDFAIGPEHLDLALARAGAAIETGDVVLLRTGRGRRWENAPHYVGEGRAPGPEEAGARWLSERRVFAAGSDTMSFEKVPSAMPVHAHLLVDHGIHIFECLNLEELARERVFTFLFLAAPLKIRGGTGSPVRPVAVVV